MVASGSRTMIAGSLSSCITGFRQSCRFSQSFHPARDARALAQGRLSLLLALEVALCVPGRPLDIARRPFQFLPLTDIPRGDMVQKDVIMDKVLSLLISLGIVILGAWVAVCTLLKGWPFGWPLGLFALLTGFGSLYEALTATED
jgi:hypothetical protein